MRAFIVAVLVLAFMLAGCSGPSKVTQLLDSLDSHHVSPIYPGISDSEVEGMAQAICRNRVNGKEREVRGLMVLANYSSYEATVFVEQSWRIYCP